jgi:hypothetical protein
MGTKDEVVKKPIEAEGPADKEKYKTTLAWRMIAQSEGLEKRTLLILKGAPSPGRRLFS